MLLGGLPALSPYPAVHLPVRGMEAGLAQEAGRVSKSCPQFTEMLGLSSLTPPPGGEMG